MPRPSAVNSTISARETTYVEAARAIGASNGTIIRRYLFGNVIQSVPVIGTLNEKADALKAQLTIAKTDAQDDLGPKITAAQAEITSALEPVSTALGTLCPSS